MKSKFLGCSLALLVAGAVFAQDWPQWALNPQHTGQASVVGQALNRNIVNLVYDPLVPQEMAQAEEFFGEEDLLAHFQAPLVDGNDVYMMFKQGPYDITNYATQTWGETKYTWSGGTLAQVWQFTTDWKAPGNGNDFWEPVFHPALANGSLYVPGAGGTIFRVNKSTGVGTRINPFNSINNKTYTASPLTVDANGNILYNVIRLGGGNDFYSQDIVDSWIIRVSPSGNIEKVSYSTLTVGAPAGNAQCSNAFPVNADGTLINGPWPPSPTAVPPTVQCGTQRPGLNIAPAVAPDGTIYVATRAHLLSRETFLVAINSNLTQKWIRSLRDRFNDGCGVPHSAGGQFPPNGAPGGCRVGALLGVDPATNRPGGGRIIDDSSATPVVAPDGSILFGAYTRYNYAQGHLMHFAANGDYLGAYLFGWDVTPGIYSHGGTYSIVTKDNHYGEVGSYCNDEAFCPSDRNASDPTYSEQYFVTQLNHNMNKEWSYQNTNTMSCTRDANGNVTCTSTNPFGFEWCVNAFGIDAAGNVYANSEDGNLFKIPQGGTGVTRIFQQLALGAAYTPTSMGNDGKIYSQNAGHLFVAGN
ncbi:MAG TPA: hypothetical protein VJZ76_11055 [Thermoanaerobaculia bacterium]|nr:hypothetical protein [Thermoanaerobaculia bacterium]